MLKVYVANNLIEAQIVLDLLEYVYIPAKLLNIHAQGVQGEIPFAHAYPEVWVIRDEDYVRGRKIIYAYEKAPIDTGIVSCPVCYEDNPRNFQLCWKCSAGLEQALYDTSSPAPS